MVKEGLKPQRFSVKRGATKKATPPRRSSGAARRRGELTGAVVTRPGGIRLRVRIYFQRHLHAFFSSLGAIYRTPFVSLMTIGAIALILALPGCLYVLLVNVQNTVGQWRTEAQITLFIDKTLSQHAVNELRETLLAKPEVSAIQTINPEKALIELQTYAHFGDALAVLDDNPLPFVLIITPTEEHQQPEAVGQFLEVLRAFPGVDIAQLDLEWIARLHAIVGFAEAGFLFLTGLLGFAVLLTIGNTIRLAIENRKDEIELSQLIGANNAFIRRPFLYWGLWFGIFGGILASLVVYGAIWVLHAPVERLSRVYGDFHFEGLHWQVALIFIGFSALLGMIGAGLVVGRHLRRIEPR